MLKLLHLLQFVCYETTLKKEQKEKRHIFYLLLHYCIFIMIASFLLMVIIFFNSNCELGYQKYINLHYKYQIVKIILIAFLIIKTLTINIYTKNTIMNEHRLSRINAHVAVLHYQFFILAVFASKFTNFLTMLTCYSYT